MKLYEIAYPDESDTEVVEILTEDEIIEQYYIYWSTKMLQNVPNADLSRENCIEDWCTIHWATTIQIPI